MPQENREFLEQQRQAMERMREMQQRSQITNNEPHQMPPVPSFVKLPGGNRPNTNSRRPTAVPPTVSNTSPRPEPQGRRTNKPEQSPKANTQKAISAPPINSPSGINLPFINNLKLDKDITLVLGLILILANEKADRRLLLALLYIMM